MYARKPRHGGKETIERRMAVRPGQGPPCKPCCLVFPVGRKQRVRRTTPGSEPGDQRYAR